VSVLTDPDAFPALHDRLYARGGAEATGRGDLASERQRAESLAELALTRLARPGRLTTTDEELELVLPLAERLGLRVRVPARARLSPVVGDRVRGCRVT
jgi:hypothetical protein